MGNQASKGKDIKSELEDEYRTGKKCEFPDSGVLHRRVYQSQIINRAIDILNTKVELAADTEDLIKIQQDILKYKDRYGNPDKPESLSFKGKGNAVKYLHDWKVLTEDSTFIQEDRQNPFEIFRQPISPLEDFSDLKRR